MPRGVPRARFDPVAKAEQVMSNLSQEALEDKATVWSALKQHGVKLSPQAMGKIRKRLLSGGSHESANGSKADVLKNVETVLKILPSVGGVEGLEQAVNIIKRVKQRA